MAFEDLAKRMGAKRGREVGDGSPIDPDQIMAEAQEAARRSQRISDLVLGSMLFFGGIGFTVFSYKAAQGGGLYVVTTGAILVGARKLFRGLFG